MAFCEVFAHRELCVFGGVLDHTLEFGSSGQRPLHLGSEPLALDEVGRAAGSGKARPLLDEALSILRALQKAGKLPQAQKTWPDLVEADLAKAR